MSNQRGSFRVAAASGVSALALWGAACSPSPSAEVPSAEVQSAKAPAMAAPPRAAPPRAAPRPLTYKPTWRGERCAEDADCGWDDPCVPVRCQRAKASSATTRRKCTETRPPPGQCLCVQNMCTLKRASPKGAASKTAGCKWHNQCEVDMPTGTCHFTRRTFTPPIKKEGPICMCTRATRRCDYQWAKPVPCRSWRDCALSHEPRFRPLRAKPRRRRRFRPCRDGSIAPVCLKGFCSYTSWDC